VFDNHFRLRNIIKRLSSSPLFTIMSVLTLALGIGANTAVFSVLNGVLLKPLPFEDPDRLVGVWHTAPGLGFDEANQSPSLHFTYQDESQIFAEIGMWDPGQVTVTGREAPQRITCMQVTYGTLPLLRIQPHMGRLFTPEDDSPESGETVMLAYGYWQKQLGGDPGVLGQTLIVEGRPREIIGVLPAELHFLDFDPDIYLPFRFDLARIFFGNFSYQGIARLAPGATIEQANQELVQLIKIASERFPMPPGFSMDMLRDAQFGPMVRPLKIDVIGDVGGLLWVLLGTVGIVLLVACANVANLFLARTESRQQELAVRTALGASRRQLAGDMLRESTLLSLLAGGIGIWLAWAGIKLLVFLRPEGLPRLHGITIDTYVILFNLGVSLLAGLIFGLLPVAKLDMASLVGAIREGARGLSSGRNRFRARNALVVTQIAMALVLLIGSGLMIRSFIALRHVYPGFVQPEEVLTLRVSIPSAEIDDPVETAAAHEQILQRLAQIPGVTSVGSSSSITMDRSNSNDPIFVEEFPMADNQLPPLRRFKWIQPGYHETMGNPVKAGRSISWADIHDRNKVVVVTESFATEYWASPAAAIGKRIRQAPGDPWREIVGVVGNVHDDGVDQEVTDTVFWPMLIEEFWGEEILVRRSQTYTVRTPRAAAPGLLKEVQQAVWSVNPNLPLANVQTLQEILQQSMARTSFTLVMLAIAAVVALLLGSVGIYGVTSYTVSQRTREIGVRIALGARRQDVNRLVLGQTLLLAVIGVVIGILAAIGLTRLLTTLLYGVDPIDPVTYGAVSCLIVAIAIAASYLPARRAAGLDPIEALRWE
jgi:predicted permease